MAFQDVKIGDLFQKMLSEAILLQCRIQEWALCRVYQK